MISLTSPVETRAHRWPAGLKLGLLSLVTFGLFFFDGALFHGLFSLAVVLLYALPGAQFFKTGCKQLKILSPFIFIVLVWHLFTAELELGLTVAFRMISAVGLANLVTMTTRLTDMIDVVHWLTRPLQKLGFKPRVLELAIALVIRMTPVLVAKGQSLALAWRARSYRRSGWRIILPFTVLALDDADHVAEALKARGGLINQEINQERK